MLRLDKIAEQFENRPVPVGQVPEPVEDGETRPGWMRPVPPRTAEDLTKRQRNHLRALVVAVSSCPTMRGGSVARACHHALKSFANPPELREAAMAFLCDLAVELDSKGAL